jgi:hypothetical protein
MPCKEQLVSGKDIENLKRLKQYSPNNRTEEQVT